MANILSVTRLGLAVGYIHGSARVVDSLFDLRLLTYPMVSNVWKRPIFLSNMNVYDRIIPPNWRPITMENREECPVSSVDEQLGALPGAKKRRMDIASTSIAGSSTVAEGRPCHPLCV